MNLQNIIKYSQSNKLIWKYKNINNSRNYQYETKYKITGKKFVYLILTKHQYDGTINIDMKIYLTTNLKHKSSYLSEIKILSDNYYMTHIKTYFLINKIQLLKLYGIIKYSNYLKQIGKIKFMNDLINMTKNDELKWFKNNFNNFICYDTIYQQEKIFLQVNKYNLYIYLNGEKFKWNQLNNIKSNKNIILYDLIKNKYFNND
jgi:hypothetical protein